MNTLKTSKLQVKSWTKDGWVTKITEPVVINNPRPFNESTDYQNNNYGEYALLSNISEKIQAGNPQEEIDKLPNNLRRIYEENGRIYMGDYGVYAKLDVSEQVDDYQEYGIYSEDSDEYESKEDIKDLVFAEENYNFERKESTLLAAEDSDNDILSVMTEEEMSYSVNQDYITNVLESSYSDIEGYRAPKERVLNVDKKWFNNSIISSCEREERFEELFQELCFCKTKKDIWGTPNEELDGSVTFSGGFMEKIRPYYNADKEIIKKWSYESKTIARRNFIKEFRGKRKESNSSKYNEEKLRKALYAKFDMATQDPSIINNEGELSVTKSSQGSEWNINRTKAYQELYLTKSQWNAIYKMKDIILSRIDMNFKSNSNRDKVIQELRDGWKEIKTREDLLDYVSNAVHRKWTYKKTTVSGEIVSKKDINRKRFSSLNIYEFKPSLIDQISIQDEFNWKLGIRKMGRALGHYSIPVKNNTLNGKKKDEFSKELTSIVNKKIELLATSKNYAKDQKIIKRIIEEYNLDISIN